MELFSKNKKNAPLADRMRPTTLDEFVGQEHLIGKGKALRKALEEDRISSMILWGPPGTGKTTLAFIIARITKSHFITFSAVLSGVKDIRNVIKEANEQWKFMHKRTILFVDEIHRFNKAQQDAFLPHVESGTIILIGATTENPSFEVISPLISRVQVYPLYPLEADHLKIIIDRALKDKERGLGKENIVIAPEVIEKLSIMANGDARFALNALEAAFYASHKNHNGVHIITDKILEDVVQKKMLLYDKAGEEHYNIISALHKSLRGSDPNASLYWLSRMLEGGEDPLFIARRLIRFASEDIGMADPNALIIAVAAMQAVHFLGMPEGDLALAEAVVYLSCAPKSNALYKAMKKVKLDIDKKPNLPVPLHIRNAPTALMKKIGYGKDYKYPHDFPNAFVLENYLPDNLKDRVYFTPSDRGKEKEIRKFLEKIWGKKYQKKENEGDKP